ncbi:MAG: hypothetical protein N3B21_04150 [Clostridia bacterium]|nr:hypothetical protein [Clostridia bacterium]
MNKCPHCGKNATALFNKLCSKPVICKECSSTLDTPTWTFPLTLLVTFFVGGAIALIRQTPFKILILTAVYLLYLVIYAACIPFKKSTD